MKTEDQTPNEYYADSVEFVSNINDPVNRRDSVFALIIEICKDMELSSLDCKKLIIKALEIIK